MALTDIQKHDVLFYLCYAGKTLIETSTHYNSTIADRLTNLNSSIEAQVADLLDCIKDIRAKLKKSQCRMGVSQVDGITFNEREHENLQKEHKRLVKELGCLLDIKPMKFSNTVGLCV